MTAYQEFKMEEARLLSEIALNTKLKCTHNVAVRKRELEKLRENFFGGDGKECGQPGQVL